MCSNVDFLFFFQRVISTFSTNSIFNFTCCPFCLFKLFSHFIKTNYHIRSLYQISSAFKYIHSILKYIDVYFILISVCSMQKYCCLYTNQMTALSSRISSRSVISKFRFCRTRLTLPVKKKYIYNGKAFYPNSLYPVSIFCVRVKRVSNK